MLRICDLQELRTKPKFWQIVERKEERAWFLEFSLTSKSSEFDGVRNKYGKPKPYKTINAAVEDIRRVSPDKAGVIIQFDE